MTNIIFLFGGPGVEREVSVATAKAAMPAFPDDYKIKPVFITPDQKWVVAETYVSPDQAWSVAEGLLSKNGVPEAMALEDIEQTAPSLVFIGLHGEYGEDGVIQAILETRGLPFTGSGAEASALAIDKPKVFQLLQDEGILVPEFLELTPDVPPADIQAFIDFQELPIVVLPADRGSSVGVTIVRDAADLDAAIAAAKQVSERVMLTKYIPGREFSAGVLVTSATEVTPLPPTELIWGAGHDFFDYDAKYRAGETQEVTPPDLPLETIKRLQGLALQVHRLVTADGYSRVDMILDSNNMVYVLEINTLPGLTPTSILPQEAKVHGLSFTQLLAAICQNVDRSDKDYLTLTTEIGTEPDDEARDDTFAF